MDKVRQDDRILLAIGTLESVHNLALPFDICVWFKGIDLVEDCNTAACGLGWLCRAPWARKLGLSTAGGQPVFEGMLGVRAGEKLLGITYPQARWLFLPEEYDVPDVDDITALMVARRMKYLLETPKWWPDVKAGVLP